MCSASVQRQASADGSMVTQLNTRLTAFIAGDQAKMDRSFPSCTTEHVHQQRQNGCFRDGIQRSNIIECEFVAVVSWKVGWWCFFFYTKFALGRLVSQFYSSLACFYPSGTTGRVVSSNTGPFTYGWSNLFNNVSVLPKVFLAPILWTSGSWNLPVQMEGSLVRNFNNYYVLLCFWWP